MVRAPARREQVRYAMARGLSTRRACALLPVARSTLDYASRMFGKDVPALAAMGLLSAQYPRFGYRRIHVFMERQGFLMGHGQVWRLWRKANMQVPCLAGGGRSPTAAAAADGTRSGLGLRLRPRCLCQWAEAEMLDGDR